MDVISFAGLDINRTTLSRLLLNRTIVFGYVLFAIALIGLLEIYHLRYFSPVVNAHDAGLNPTDPAMIEAMRQAVFGTVGEIDRDSPWTLLISNYMYMLYTGSGIIFLVALAELMKLNVVAKAAAGFMVLGLAMVFAGLFTIMTDLHLLNMLWMLFTPNMQAPIWMMFPLYLFYIPFVLFEIYLLITNKRTLARKLALPIMFLSIGVDLIEYYIQASLFAMNNARHLWTDYPALTFYFIVSAFVSALGVMTVYATLVHKNKAEYQLMLQLFRKALMVSIVALALFEVVGYLTMDTAWREGLMFGPYQSLYFFAYLPLTLLLPLALIAKGLHTTRLLIASVFVIAGGYLGRFLFVYGGNVVPMSNRFGTGYEVTESYAVAEPFIHTTPHLGEMLIAAGSVGIVIIVYQLFDGLFSVGNLRETH
jgi:hypothetical protein